MEVCQLGIHHLLWLLLDDNFCWRQGLPPTRPTTQSLAKVIIAMAQLPWYKDGLKFECTQCGNCCTGAPGFVWVNKAEIEALARELGSSSVEEFESNYVRLVGIRKSLKELPHSNWDCVFFDSHTRQCRVYDVRPQQCRTWPFWDSNLRDRDAWKQTCETCPGSGQGKIYQLASIEEQRKKVRV